MYLTKNPTQNVTNVRKIIHKGASFNKVRINNLSTDVVDDPLHLPGCFLTLGGLHIGGLPPTRRGVAAASLVDAETSLRVQNCVWGGRNSGGDRWGASL